MVAKINRECVVLFDRSPDNQLTAPIASTRRASSRGSVTTRTKATSPTSTNATVSSTRRCVVVVPFLRCVVADMRSRSRGTTTSILQRSAPASNVELRCDCLRTSTLLFDLIRIVFSTVILDTETALMVHGAYGTFDGRRLWLWRSVRLPLLALIPKRSACLRSTRRY